MADIKTYPEMNKTIKDLLRLNDEPMYQYILTRIEELEKQVEALTPPPNAPLTLEELREIGFGEWVWIQNFVKTEGIVAGYYQRMDGYRPEDAFYFGYPKYEKVGYTAFAQYTDYGKTWLAYRRKPEEVHT